MSLVDEVFGLIPGPLIDQWGIDGVYIKSADSEQTYDPETGTYETPILGDDRISVKLIPMRIKPQEVQGEVQVTDTKFLISASSLGNYFPKVDDKIEYDQAEFTVTLKVIQPLTHRGSLPILHSIIARSIMVVDNSEPGPVPERFQAVKETRIDASVQGVIYVGKANYGTIEASPTWTITRSTYDQSGVRLTKLQATDVTWTGRTGHTYS